MLLPRRLSFRPRTIVILLLSTPLCYFWFFRLKPALHHHYTSPQSDLEAFSRLLPIQAPSPDSEGPSVNLVVATTSSDSITWTDNLRIPHLTVIRYISDSPSAKYHPPQPKGREALMYLTYMHDFYDHLPDISIFVHAAESPWHMDGALLESMTFALQRLDLDQVIERAYFNLRVNWKHGCPAQINTTKTAVEEMDEKKPEQHLMASAFFENFRDDSVPEILAGPCCSQFAVSRPAILSRPRAAYAHYMALLLATPLPDALSGRIWEHFWPYLFLHKPVECPIEWKALCKMYRVCFRGEGRALSKYQQVWDARRRVDANVTFWGSLWRASGEMEGLRRRRGEYTEWLFGRLGEAVEAGREDDGMVARLGDLYTP